MSLFPALNPTTFEPLPELFTLQNYFNPYLNRNYLDTASSNASYNLISLQDYTTILKSLVSNSLPEHLLFETLPIRGIAYSDPIFGSLFQYVYDLIPSEHKYLAHQATLVFETHSNGEHLFSFRFLHPGTIRSNEAQLLYKSVPLKTIKVTDRLFEPIAADKERFTTDLIAASTFIHNDYESKRAERLVINDRLISPFVSMFYKFANNRGIYLPTDPTARAYGMYTEWMRPTEVVNMSFDPSLVSFSNRNAWSGLKLEARMKPGDRRGLEQILNYSANVLEYLPYTIKGPKEPASTLYGVELEACSDYSPKEIIAAQKDLFFILKQDSSITGSKIERYEMVTVPASLRAHKRLWAEFFEKVDYRQFDTTKETGNGMHVHIDRKAFSKAHLNRFTWFIINPANKDFLFTVSERPTKRNLDEWANTPNTSAYSKKVKAAICAVTLNGRMRGAVHFKANKTVEVRIFKGIVSYATVVKNLEFVDSVVEFTRVTNLSQVTLKNYFSWLSTQPSNKYTVLRTFFTEAKAEQHLPLAELTEYVWNVDDEEVVTEKLNRAPFKVTPEHITSLNKKKKKRTFVLKKGVVTCLTKRGGMLSKLDLDIQKKQTRGAATFAMTNV
jgi:hypothetical protein